ncbi:MAG: hypothetical protein ABI821_08360 [Pseudomonadota bacterium]
MRKTGTILIHSIWLSLATALLVVGCANQKEPAMKMVAEAESALAGIKDDAAKLLPSDLQSVEASVAALKDDVAKGDYKAVLAGAPAVMSAINSLKEAVAARKSEVEAAMAAATAEWGSLSADVPKMVEAIQSRLDILGKAKKLPKSLSQEAFDSAKSGLDSMKSMWAEASSAFTSGDAVNAVEKAKGVKAKGEEVLKLLGMSPG